MRKVRNSTDTSFARLRKVQNTLDVSFARLRKVRKTTDASFARLRKYQNTLDETFASLRKVQNSSDASFARLRKYQKTSDETFARLRHYFWFKFLSFCPLANQGLSINSHYSIGSFKPFFQRAVPSLPRLYFRLKKFNSFSIHFISGEGSKSSAVRYPPSKSSLMASLACSART